MLTVHKVSERKARDRGVFPLSRIRHNRFKFADLIYGHTQKHHRAVEVCRFLQQVLGPRWSRVLHARGVCDDATPIKWITGQSSPHKRVLEQVERYAVSLGYSPIPERPKRGVKAKQATVIVDDHTQQTKDVLESLNNQLDTETQAPPPETPASLENGVVPVKLTLTESRSQQQTVSTNSGSSFSFPPSQSLTISNSPKLNELVGN